MITDAHLEMELPFHNLAILSKFDGKSSKVNQVIGIPNMKVLAKILFEITCTQNFQILFSKGHNSKRGHDSDMKKYGSTIFS